MVQAGVAIARQVGRQPSGRGERPLSACSLSSIAYSAAAADAKDIQPSIGITPD